MADPAAIDPADPAARSLLDQAAADDSITQARTRAVDPVPIVVPVVVQQSAPAGATLEPVLETNEPDMGVNGRMNTEAQAADGSTAEPAPVAGARRRLSPRPVPVSRRRRPPAAATEVTTGKVATDEERTPAEEMDDVGTQDEKGTAGTTPDKDAGTGSEVSAGLSTDATGGAGAATGSGTATATKTARPKTAAEIVAEQRAREKAAAEAPSGAAASEDAAPGQPAETKDKPATGTTSATAAVTPVAKPSGPTGASGNKPPTARGGASGSSGSGKGKQALSSVGSGVRKLRNLIASLIWLIAVLAAAVLALGALFTALDQTNQSNEIVRWILERGHDLVGPFKDLFRLETAKNTLLVNWGIAALVYLIAGKIVERIIRP
ncbi:hypothetical protein [Kribbella jiaozuonensis]|uniref:Uncharacterized protein n=1 Tax=Kribbella jiaozuonensis TaxID=2575441 RepID=A0A4U3LF02_9ACTN|nr:hypothetical protein [Kribbella jiaozuonensis]TKK73459.1 hypothetical protein FDA38_39820 [Kribbella jiaozuonensis]